MLFISSSVLKAQRISQAVSTLARAGISNIELSGGTRPYHGLVQDLVELKSRYGINYLVHGYFPPPQKDFIVTLVSEEQNALDASVSLIRESLAVASEIGAGQCSTHAGFVIDVMPLMLGGRVTKPARVIENHHAKKIYYSTLESLMRDVQAGGIRLAVENMYPVNGWRDCAFFTTPEDMREYVEFASGHKGLGLLLDLGHLNITARAFGFDPARAMREIVDFCGDRLYEVHLSANDGLDDDHRINGEDSWQLEIFDLLRGRREVPVVCEWRAGEMDMIIDAYHRLSGLEK